MTKPFQAGHAAEGGVVASDLVALGWTAAENILEAKRGFFEAEGGGFDPAVMERLGQPWTMVTPGVSIKPFPSGSLTHPGMTLLQQLIRTQHVRAEEVVQVRVGRKPANAQYADPPPAQNRSRSEVRYGVLHGHPADHRWQGIAK